MDQDLLMLLFLKRHRQASLSSQIPSVIFVPTNIKMVGRGKNRNYGAEEGQFLLDILEQVLPIGTEE